MLVRSDSGLRPGHGEWKYRRDLWGTLFNRRLSAFAWTNVDYICRGSGEGLGNAEGDSNTIRMPYIAQKFHARRVQRVIFGKLQFGREDATFKGSAIRALDQGFPEEDVVFGDGAGGDAVGR